MSKPDLFPEQSAAGIAVDPRTLERVIPESRRPDGSLRKERKIRPGYTPQEDVSRFRGSRQQQLDRNALPKGHILGWVAPSSDSKKTPARTSPSMSSSSDFPSLSSTGSLSPTPDKPLSKSAAKHAKRKAKKQAEKDQKILENWDDDDDDDDEPPVKAGKKGKKGEELSAEQSQDGSDASPSKAAPEAVRLATEVLEAKDASEESKLLPPEGSGDKVNVDDKQAEALADELENLTVR